MENNFEMVAKTFQGLEEVLAEELRELGAVNVMPGKRMVSFEGDKEMLYRANLGCRTAVRILKPFYKFQAGDPDSLYEMTKEFDWSSLLSVDKTFAIDTVAYSDDFRHSRFATYRVKDAIVDWFRDRLGEDQRPSVRLTDADILINVHISGNDVTLSLDSSGEPLFKRGYRVAQTEAPINEVLAAGIILRSGWRGESPFVDPMCGSGTFLIEAALIAANINPGIYRKGFAFERWPDFDGELFDKLYNDDSGEREFIFKIYGADISPKAIEVAKANIKSAGVGRYIELERRPIAQWEEAPRPAGVLVTNPPYGERISAPDMEGLYASIGSVLKHVFTGYHAWILGYNEDYIAKIGMAPSEKIEILNGSLECQLREYIVFDGDRKSFVRDGGKIGKGEAYTRPKEKTERRRDADWQRDDSYDFGRRSDERRNGFGRRDKESGAEGGRRSDERRGIRFGRNNDQRFGGLRRRDDDSKSGFGKRDEERRGGFGRRDDNRRDGFKERRYEGKGRYEDTRGPKRFNREPEPESDNPLAKRRNPHALRFIEGRQPRLFDPNAPKENPGKVMRSRGWKKKSDK